jgi:hypothetical protein
MSSAASYLDPDTWAAFSSRAPVDDFVSARKRLARLDESEHGSAVLAIATRETRGGDDGVNGVRPAGVSVGLYPASAVTSSDRGAR